MTAINITKRGFSSSNPKGHLVDAQGNLISYADLAGTLAGTGNLATPNSGSGLVAAGTGISIATANGVATISASGGGGGGSGLYNQVMSATPTSAGTGLTTWVNQGTATVADSTVGVAITKASTAGDDFTARSMAAPATPYTITALVSLCSDAMDNAQGIAIGWYDGTAKLHMVMLQFNNAGAPHSIYVIKYSAPTSPTVTTDFGVSGVCTNPIWFQIQDDGTTVYFRYSFDGANFRQAFSVAKASGYLGSSGYSNLIFGVDTKNSGLVGTLMSWKKS